MTPWRGRVLTLALALGAVACENPTSTLDPAGRDAAEIARLFWWMAAGAAVIWVIVMAGAVYCARARPGASSPRTHAVLIAGLGVTVPSLLLILLLAFALPPLRTVSDAQSTSTLTIAVTGERWWWRVRYEPPGQPAVDLANELRLPVGARVDVHLRSTNVIHSFWVPSLSGKVDMIPGRETRLSLEPLRTGRFQGICAEYCGTAHALMTFDVTVVDRDEFDRWLDQQRDTAVAPADAVAARGHDAFLQSGCGACHTVRGTPAKGTIGPDLTHLGSRQFIGAGTRPMTVDHIAAWIREPRHQKPDARMPPFASLGEADILAIAAYLQGLR